VSRYDETSGRHFFLQEIETISDKPGQQEGHTRQASVNLSGQLRSEHDLKVAGFMNYKQRQTYARVSSKDNLHVDSPRSLSGKATNTMYLPRQDKFEGYSQFPRPRLPPPATKFGSFLARVPHSKGLGQIYQGERNESEIPVKELMERQAKRRLEQEIVSKKTEQFMKANLGFLTGTLAGVGSLRHTRVSSRQVGELALPK